MKINITLRALIVAIVAFFALAACTAPPPQLAPPAKFAELNIQPIEDNTGKYMSPITSDGVAAEWVDNSINASIGANVGATVGAMVGEQLVESIPFIGGFLGSEIGEAVGRETALAAAGGEEFIKETSDLSFNSLDSMAVYMYATYGENPNFNDVLQATFAIYPEFQQQYMPALYSANAQLTP